MYQGEHTDYILPTDVLSFQAFLADDQKQICYASLLGQLFTL